MHKGDPFHHESMADNMEVMVKHVTAARKILDFVQSIKILAKQYEVKTYTTLHDGIVDEQNAKLEVIGPLLTVAQETEQAERVRYMKEASVTLCPDHVFGEPMKHPYETMDPRSFTAAQWIKTDWVKLHGLRVPAVRLNAVGQHIHDRADKSVHPHQIVKYQPMIFIKDHNPA